MVLEAYDRALDRNVAVKLLLRDEAGWHAKRLLREAKGLAKLSNSNVVQVYDVGVVNEQLFIAMELVKGQTLRQWSMDRDRPWQQCVQAYLQAGRGLAAAHAQRLVHRDFKPSNCIIDEAGHVKVLDFGLVREASSIMSATDDELDSLGVAVAAGASGDGVLHDDLTRTGVLMGTPAYMSLEQVTGKLVDARSDQFSFCVALYEAIYEERPFDGTTLEEMYESLSVCKVRPVPRGSRVTNKVRRVLLRGLSYAPDQRWPTMEALLGELARVVQPRRSRWIAALGGGLLGVLGMSIGPRVDEQAVQPCPAGWKHWGGAWGARYEQAADHPERALKTRGRVPGIDHPHGEPRSGRLSRVLHSQGEYEQAAEYHRRALNVRERALDFSSYSRECRILKDSWAMPGDPPSTVGDEDGQLGVLDEYSS